MLFNFTAIFHFTDKSAICIWMLFRWADKQSSVGKDDKDPRLCQHPFVQASYLNEFFYLLSEWIVGNDEDYNKLYSLCALQALGMFFGEMLCLFAFMFIWSTYKCRGLPWVAGGEQKFNILIFLPPALLDMIATSLMYTALNLTYPSSYQMLRGSYFLHCF